MIRRCALALSLLAAACDNPAPTATAGDARAPDAARPIEAGLVADGAAPPKPSAQAPQDAGVDDTAMPPASSEELNARMRHLVEAIAQDNPELAVDALLPRDAYVAAFDAQDPGKVWERKVGNAFRKQVHAAHKRLKGSERATFVAFEIGKSVVQTTPRKREWKRALWRVKRSKVTLAIDGKQLHVDIGEMISWRGAWYVSKLR